MNRLEELLVESRISRGVFPGEYAVELTTKSGQNVSFFSTVDYLSNLDLDKGTALLRVGVVRTAPDVLLVYLPQPTLETGTQWVELPGKQEMFSR